MFPVLLFTVVACALAAPASKETSVKIPKFVKICYRDQPDLNDCLKDAVQDIFPKMARGIKELDIPPVDPMHIEESIYEYGNGLFAGKAIVKNAYVYGLSDAKFKKFEVNFDDPNNIVMEAEMHEDTARVEGNFKMQGKFLNFPIRGHGPFNVTGEDVNIHWKLTGALISKNGEKYLRVKTYLITPTFGNMFTQASNLFEGNEAISQAIVDMVNQYWRIGYEQTLPFVQTTWDKVFRTIANRVFQRVPFDQLFPTSQ